VKASKVRVKPPNTLTFIESVENHLKLIEEAPMLRKTLFEKPCSTIFKNKNY
jgi:hypothetical protein